jgi:hypothetical protein
MLFDTKARPPKAAARRPVAAEPHTAAPVKWWAAVGAVFVVFAIVVLTRWVTGPLFETV